MGLGNNSSPDSIELIEVRFLDENFEALDRSLVPALDLDDAAKCSVRRFRIRNVRQDGEIPANDRNINFILVLLFKNTNGGFTLGVDQLSHDVLSELYENAD